MKVGADDIVWSLRALGVGHEAEEDDSPTLHTGDDLQITM